ncbi:MAG: GNAT family N-acetyltransferase [Anaerolinea sp.]|nr:GNAT family N-acetyltransferase [Anaerolinea sp.]
MTGYQIKIEFSPALEDQQIVQNGLRQHNDQHVPADGDSSFAVFLRGADGAIIGGVLARAGRGWLRIGTLWVEAGLRGQGYGRHLMTTAEAKGRQRGCHGSYGRYPLASSCSCLSVGYLPFANCVMQTSAAVMAGSLSPWQSLTWR